MYITVGSKITNDLICLRFEEQNLFKLIDYNRLHRLMNMEMKLEAEIIKRKQKSAV